MCTMRLLTATALALSLVAPLLAVTPEERTLELPWRSNYWSHAWVESGTLALRHGFILDQDPLWLQAGEASFVAPVAAAQGGEAVSPQRLEFFLEVSKPGKYYTWYRLRVREAGTVQHLEGVDSAAGAPIGWVSLEVKEPGVWTWTRREHPLEYKAGLHELQMDAWTPGVDLSQIVLVSDEKWTPPEAEPLPAGARPVPWTEGTAYSSEAQPSSVLKWRRLSYAAEPGGGKIALSYSTDGGKTWAAVPEGGDLSDIAVKADGTDRLRCRAILTRAAGEASPRIGPLTLAYTGDRDDLFSLSDATARYFFAKKTGALCGIQNVVTGTWLTPERRPQPVFSVRLRPVTGGPQKDWETVTSLDARCLSATALPSRAGSREVSSATFTYEIARPEGKALVILKCTQTGPGELTWTAEVSNGLKQSEIVDLTYPIAYGVVAGTPQTDTMLINGNYLVKTPANFGHFLYYWPTQTAPLMDVFSEQQGLALVAHDDTMRSTGISARGLEREAVELSLVKVVRIKPGQSFSGAPHVMRVHQGDWHQTALAERPWLAAHRPTAEPPLWLAECDGWVPTGWPAGWWVNMGVFADKMRAENGFGWIQYWNFQVPGTTWTIPHPNPVNGDEEELRWGIDQIHRRGMRTTCYIQGLLYDPQGDGTDPNDPIGHLHRRDLWPGYELPGPGFAEQWARRTADGEIHEWSKTEREMCYASRGFQEYKRKWAIDRFMGRLGLDGIYWDSLSRGDTCWGTDHGHGDDPGQWGIGAQANHTLILEQARKLNPTAVFATEGPPIDTLGNVVDVHLDNAPSLDVVRFLFPKMLIYLGSADGADPTRKKSFLYGCRFDGIGTDPEQQQLLRIRRLTKQYLYPATPMDTMGLKIEVPRGAGFQPATPGDGLQARWFLCDPQRTKGAVVTILNEQKVEGAMIAVPTHQIGPVKAIWAVDSDGADGSWDGGRILVDDGKAHLRVPAAQAATILLLGSGAEPRVTVTHDSLVSRGGEAKVTVKLESLTGETVRGTVSAMPPGARATGGGKQTAPPVKSTAFECKDGAPQTVTLTLPVDSAAPLGLSDVPVEIRVTGGASLRKVATFYVEPPVRVTPTWARPDLLKIVVENRSRAAQKGTVTLHPYKGAVQFAEGETTWNVNLAPGAQNVISVPLIGAYACQTPWSVKGELKVGGQSYPLYTPFRAAILNGSLELYKWRPDVPDWWWGTYVDRSPKIWGMGEYGVDHTMAADGKCSLKVVGKADEWRAANLDLVLKPGQTYRFSCKIRRTVNARGIYASLHETRRLPDGKTEAVSHIIGRQTEGPLNEWQEFSTVFTALPPGEQAGARLYLYNDHTEGTAWFDDIRLVPEEAE